MVPNLGRTSIEVAVRATRSGGLLLLCSLPLALSLIACSATDAAQSDGPIRRIDDVGAGKGWLSFWPELRDEGFTGDRLTAGVFPARAPSADQLRGLKAAETAWRTPGGTFGAVATPLLDDPLATFWLCRMLVRDLLAKSDRAAADATAFVGSPGWERPYDALVELGAKAVPCVVLDLLRADGPHRRDLAARVLGEMGPAVLPAWVDVLEVDDSRTVRAAVRALGNMPPDDRARRPLEGLLESPDFGIRAEAGRALAAQGAAGVAVVRDALATERDPFVRCAILEGLGGNRDRESAAMLVAALEAALASRTVEEIRTARASLMQMSGRRQPGSLVSWQQWLTEFETKR
ncbi:MAG: HEAT repeat domain-containing protein [Planctomycetota bacterium]